MITSQLTILVLRNFYLKHIEIENRIIVSYKDSIAEGTLMNYFNNYSGQIRDDTAVATGHLTRSSL